MSNDLNREELNQLAAEKGIENPESYGTKAELQAAIDNVSDENHTEDVTNTTDEESVPEQKAEDLGEDAVAPSEPEEDHTTEENHKAEATTHSEPGSEADGTAELETPQDAFESRNEAVQIGKDTARENIERERAENQVDGE